MEESNYGGAVRRSGLGGIVGNSSTLSNIPVKESDTSRTVIRLQSLSAENSDMVLSLLEKLQPVLRQIPPNVSENEKTQPVLPPLPEALQNIGNKIYQTNNRISDILSRLEL